MHKLTLFIASLALSCSLVSNAQTVATFDSLSFAASSNDTFYVNYSNSGHDVGFDDGLAHFPCIYDTSFGGYWSSGFAYSRLFDSNIGGLPRQYAAKPGLGYDNSGSYAVAYGSENVLSLNGAAKSKSVLGFFITNSTYAYYSMKNGDAFAKKFGGGHKADSTGSEPDWYKLIVRGVLNGNITTDSVEFYLADFRSTDSMQKYIVNSWQWINLIPLGHVDSLLFTLSSTDTAGGFGMNTPAYFCMDNFTTNETAVKVSGPTPIASIKIYPNPAHDQLNVEAMDNSVEQITIFDPAGKTLGNYRMNAATLQLNTSTLAPGNYFIQISGAGHTGMGRFIKQ